MATKLTYIVSHPIQYQAPLLRRIADESGIRLRVLFERVTPGHRYFDEGFQRDVQWDVPLTEGYDFAALDDTDLKDEIAAADALWVHGWQSPTIRRAMRLAHGLGKPVLMRGENCDMAMPDGSGPRGWLKRRYLARIFSHCAAFLAIGSLNRRYYLSRGVTPERIFYMPYAVDNASFAAAAERAHPTREKLKQRLGIAAERPVVLFSGKLSRRKRPDLLARAVGALGDDAPALVFAGDGEMMDEMQRTAPDAVYPGFLNQSELPAFYDLADVFVLPSEKEPWGLAVNEAMACGTPVVVSDQVGAAPDLVDGKSGILFESGNADALGRAIVTCLNDAAAMGAHARATIAGWGFDADIAGLNEALSYTKPPQ